MHRSHVARRRATCKSVDSFAGTWELTRDFTSESRPLPVIHQGCFEEAQESMAVMVGINGFGCIGRNMVGAAGTVAHVPRVCR